MLKTVSKRLTSPIVFLLILTLVFGTITLIIQLFLIDINPLSSSISLLKSYKKREYFQSSNIKNENLDDESLEIINKFDYDFEKCKNLLKANLELKDLRRIKSSYLNELKQAELKRNSLLKTLNQLQFQVETHRLELEKLKQQNQLIKYKILNNMFKLNDHEYKLSQSLSSLQILKTNYEFKSEKMEIYQTRADSLSFCELDDCFEFSRCKINQKLSLYLFKDPEVGFILENLDLKQLNYSVDLVDEPSGSCLVGVVLLARTNTAYYERLIQFLLNIKRNEHNFMLINPLDGEFKQKVEFKHFFMSLEKLKSLAQTESAKFEFEFIGRSLFASFSSASVTNSLNTHFSISLNVEYLSQQLAQHNNVLLRYDYKDRKYLLSYHQAHEAGQKVGYLKRSLEAYSSVLFETSCQGNSSSLCYDLHKRTSVLLESTFTLLISSENEPGWSAEMTYRLVEALKCSTIPVVIDSSLKLPLSELIAWDEIIIRVPYAHVNYLLPILSGIEQADLSNRRIKARNVYNSYFSTLTNQFRTLMASIQHRIGLPLYPMAYHTGVQAWVIITKNILFN